MAHTVQDRNVGSLYLGINNMVQVGIPCMGTVDPLRIAYYLQGTAPPIISPPQIAIANRVPL